MPLELEDRGPMVSEVQQALVALGYPLPRFGADGQFGDETYSAFEDFAHDHSLELAPQGKVITEPQLFELRRTYERVSRFQWHVPLQDHTSKHPLAKPRFTYARTWKSIRGICLHQTACLLGEHPERWYSVAVHFAVTREGRVFYLNRCTLNLPAANGLNPYTISIEVDGTFEGVEGDRATWWPSPGFAAPLHPTPLQLETARKLCVDLAALVQAHGGNKPTLYAHRQASADRRSDPGSAVWQGVALPLVREYGLSTLPEFKTGTGKGIPKEWDPQSGVKY